MPSYSESLKTVNLRTEPENFLKFARFCPVCLAGKKRTYIERFKGALSCLRQLLATENRLKMMRNAFYFTSKDTL